MAGELGRGVERLACVIDAHLREWGGAPHVELAVHGTGDPRAIATEIDAFCRRELESPVAEALWYQSSIGAVAGLRVEDGRRVVVKGHQPERSAERAASGSPRRPRRARSRRAVRCARTRAP